MKINPRKAALIGLAATTVFTAAGCAPGFNQHENVYGPPEWYGPDEPGNNTKPAVTDRPEITPDLNEIEAVYGPPEMFDPGYSEDNPITPAQNELEDVYGPPGPGIDD